MSRSSPHPDPLPPGEGQGEGERKTGTHFDALPHPCPLPAGEGEREGGASEWWPTAFASILALAATVFFRTTAGRGHGVFFGGVVVVTLITPYFTLIERTLAKRAAVFLATTAGVAAVWLSDSSREIGWTAEAAVLLLAYASALCGVTVLLRRLRLPDIAAAAITVALALAWLSCPIWLSTRLAGRDVAMDRLARAHPLLSLDGMLASTDRPWSEHEIFYYHLGNLNQDVVYDPPATPWRAAGLHSVIGVVALALAHVRLRSRAGGVGGVVAD